MGTRHPVGMSTSLERLLETGEDDSAITCVVRSISKFSEDGLDRAFSPEGEAFLAELSRLDHILVV